MAYYLTKTVVLVGMMGSGKTAIGTALARRLDVPFLDSDHEIERAANETISEIFETYGEAFFREKEGQVLARLLAGPPAVLATGGGAFLAAANREIILREGASLWLDASVDLLWSRVQHKDTRPLLRTDNPLETLKELVAARVPFYTEAAIKVTAEAGASIAETTERVVAALVASDVVRQEG